LGDSGSMLRSPPASASDRSRRLETAFRSPTLTFRYRNASVGSTLPTCFFSRHA
jgi:hypothetical protein